MPIAQCAHECIGFSGCYPSQQLSQNNILLTTIKFKTFQHYFIKFKDFKALNLVQSNSRLFKTFKAPYGPCLQVQWIHSMGVIYKVNGCVLSELVTGRQDVFHTRVLTSLPQDRLALLLPLVINPSSRNFSQQLQTM